MSSVIRVSSGDTLQIRTGVVQGIGPQGPTGPTGAIGPQGEQGPMGERGPIGNVGEFVTDVRGGGSQPVASSTDTLVNFDQIVLDEYTAVQSLTNLRPGNGNFYVTVYVKISKPSSASALGTRVVRVRQGGTTIAAASCDAPPTISTELSIATGIRITDPNELITVQVRQEQGATMTIEAARLWLTRTGPGPQGIQGIQGPVGPIGPPGPQGSTGPAGTIGSNNTTFAALEAGTG